LLYIDRFNIRAERSCIIEKSCPATKDLQINDPHKDIVLGIHIKMTHSKILETHDGVIYTQNDVFDGGQFLIEC
jgi:hypothetical protein